MATGVHSNQSLKRRAHATTSPWMPPGRREVYCRSSKAKRRTPRALEIGIKTYCFNQVKWKSSGKMAALAAEEPWPSSAAGYQLGPKIGEVRPREGFARCCEMCEGVSRTWRLLAHATSQKNVVRLDFRAPYDANLPPLSSPVPLASTRIPHLLGCVRYRPPGVLSQPQ